MSGSLHVVGHPLIQHKLTQMRRKETETRDFRRLAREIALPLGPELRVTAPVPDAMRDAVARCRTDESV